MPNIVIYGSKSGFVSNLSEITGLISTRGMAVVLHVYKPLHAVPGAFTLVT